VVSEFAPHFKTPCISWYTLIT